VARERLALQSDELTAAEEESTKAQELVHVLRGCVDSARSAWKEAVDQRGGQARKLLGVGTEADGARQRAGAFRVEV